MKTKKRQFLALSAVVALTLSIAVTSCKKDKDDAPKPFTATVNGTALEFSDATGVAGNSMIRIDASPSKDTLSYIIVNIPEAATANTKYNFEDLDMYYYDSKKNVIYANFASGTHGSLTVDSHDKSSKKVVGKFDGVLYGWTTTNDSVVLKNGAFNITYK
jgi:hypothetical protein